MIKKRAGRQTVFFATPPKLISGAAIVGDVEGRGPLGNRFDLVLQDDTWGEDSWEKAERKMFEHAVRLALQKCCLPVSAVDILLGGDLLNQIISANFAARELCIPFLGLYGACSTMAESLLLGSMLIDGGYAERAACASASHFSTAERQFRFPLEMGGQTTPTAQRTVTGAGASLLVSADDETKGCFSAIRVAGGTVGRVVDLGITDANNLGAAMAPAAADTLAAHFRETGKTAADYDLIVTGDLGSFGSEMFRALCGDKGIDLLGRHCDCGSLIFSPEQKVDCGGSGCGCSAVTLNGFLLKEMEAGNLASILFMATGALMSTTAGMQGESIPGIAHAVVLEREN